MLKFPAIKPNVQEDSHGWFDQNNKDFLKPLITSETKVIVELGSWLGSSTRWFCENSSSIIISIDHWKGSIEHQGRKDVKDKIPTLYETFIVNCWEYRDRIMPVKMNTIAGMNYIKDIGVNPDIIFIDASHEYVDVVADIKTASELFPSAILVGDDWSWRNRKQDGRFTVREAVEYFKKKNNVEVVHNSRCWMIKK